MYRKNVYKNFFKRWPENGCCAYQETFPVERANLGKTREAINIGLLDEKVQALKCQVVDIVSSKTKNLVDSRTKSGKPTVILFWTKWFNWIFN